MKYKNIPTTDLYVSNIALGCMRISKMTTDEVEKLILKALELGINLFDHADIYGGGKSESLFGEVLKRNPPLRSQMIIQTKCGIKNGYYDNSKQYLIESVKQSLKRLQTNYLDVLLIHRPDALMDVDEVGEAFEYLHSSGMVRYFGVSNMNSWQIELLQKYVKQKIIINQLQLSIVHSLLIDEGLNVNMRNSEAINRSGDFINYSRLNEITIQAWSVLQASWEDGTFLNNPKYHSLNESLLLLANKYQVTPAAIAISWILRHPAKIQAIVGTTSIKHLVEISKASLIELERKEFYDLYLSVDRKLP